MRELEDRVAVIMGAGSGIGEALAREAARHGMRVVVADIERPAAERVAGAIEAAGGRATPAHVDVTERDSMVELAACTRAELGGAHLLINNAGVLVTGPLADATPADWEWVLGVNVMGVVHGVGAFLPQLLEASGARHILNTGSIAGLVTLPAVGVYAASKHAVVGFSETLHAELAPSGIGVSVLCPGGVKTRLLEADRNRPQELAGRRIGEAEVRAVSDAVDDDPEAAMDPGQVAAAAFAGIHAGELFIITHPELEPLLDARAEELRGAFRKAGERVG